MASDGGQDTTKRDGTMDGVLQVVRDLWVVWLMALFIGVVVWVLRPRKTKEYERASRIPLDDQEPRPKD